MSSWKRKHGDDCCFSCCEEKELVQDKLCCDFTVPETAMDGGSATVIYATDAAVSCENLVAPGTIKNCGPNILRVQFLRGTTLVRQVDVPEGGCFTFVVARFDTIRAFLPQTPFRATSGQICLTPRYTI